MNDAWVENLILGIKDVAFALGLKETQLRYWSDLGLLKPQVSKSGYRRFDIQQIRVAAQIKAALEAGYSLKDLLADDNETSATKETA